MVVFAVAELVVSVAVAVPAFVTGPASAAVAAVVQAAAAGAAVAAAAVVGPMTEVPLLRLLRGSFAVVMFVAAAAASFRSVSLTSFVAVS